MTVLILYVFENTLCIHKIAGTRSNLINNSQFVQLVHDKYLKLIKGAAHPWKNMCFFVYFLPDGPHSKLYNFIFYILYLVIIICIPRLIINNKLLLQEGYSSENNIACISKTHFFKIANVVVNCWYLYRIDTI